ncbi:MAG: helix-turn-helix transcriptional regulator [Bryobacteraceae bacterium]
MSELGKTIRGIRNRLGKTMVEFAEIIGAKQSTVSRYEAGKLIPGRPVLLLLLQLAKGNESGPVLDALGVEKGIAQGWNTLQLLEALKTFEGYLEGSRSDSRVRRVCADARPSLEAFAEVAQKILLQCRDVDSSVVRILNHWLDSGTDPSVVEFFRHAAAYLDVELKASQYRAPKNRRRSQSSLSPQRKS